mgnify:FL=1
MSRSHPRGVSDLNRSFHRDDIADLAATMSTELDIALTQCEESVAATTNPVTRVEVSTAPADDDLTGLDDLTAKTLKAEAAQPRPGKTPG